MEPAWSTVDGDPEPVGEALGGFAAGEVSRWDQEPWFSESMVIPQNPAKIQKSIIFVVFLMFFWEILANSRSRDREESIPIDLDPFHPILTHFISI